MTAAWTACAKNFSSGKIIKNIVNHRGCTLMNFIDYILMSGFVDQGYEFFIIKADNGSRYYLWYDKKLEFKAWTLADGTNNILMTLDW